MRTVQSALKSRGSVSLAPLQDSEHLRNTSIPKRPPVWYLQRPAAFQDVDTFGGHLSVPK